MTKRIYTGYFARVNQYKTMGLTPISIARNAPQFYDGVKALNFAPSYALLHSYKSELINETEYEAVYREEISKVNLKQTLENIQRLPSEHGYVLLCWEKSDSFCHRHILARIIKEQLGIDITEVVLGQSLVTS